MKDIVSTSDNVVYEFCVKVREPKSQAIIYLGDTADKNSIIATLATGGTLKFADDKSRRYMIINHALVIYILTDKRL